MAGRLPQLLAHLTHWIAHGGKPAAKTSTQSVGANARSSGSSAPPTAAVSGSGSGKVGKSVEEVMALLTDPDAELKARADLRQRVEFFKNDAATSKDASSSASTSASTSASKGINFDISNMLPQAPAFSAQELDLMVETLVRTPDVAALVQDLVRRIGTVLEAEGFAFQQETPPVVHKQPRTWAVAQSQIWRDPVTGHDLVLGGEFVMDKRQWSAGQSEFCMTFAETKEDHEGHRFFVHKRLSLCAPASLSTRPELAKLALAQVLTRARQDEAVQAQQQAIGAFVAQMATCRAP